MPKINLNELDDEKALTQIRRYHKNKFKNGIGYGQGDPYLTTMNICRKFIISVERSEQLLKILKDKGTRMSAYVELGWTGKQIVVSTRKRHVE